MELVRGNSFASIAGAPLWFLQALSRHLSIKISRDHPRDDRRFGESWWYQGELYGSLLLGNRVPVGLLRHVWFLAAHYGLPRRYADARGPRPAPVHPGRWARDLPRPRPYQERIHAAALERGAGVIDAPPRSGKTLQLARLIDALGLPALYLAPSLAIVGQTYRVLCRHFGQERVARVDGTTRESERDLSKMIVVATVPSALKLPPEFFRTRHVLAIDECFPAGTLVDGRAIEDIKIGDVVQTVDHQSGQLLHRRVVRTFSRDASSLLELRLGRTAVRCTPEHPVFVKERGYVEAQNVRVGDLCCLLEEVCSCCLQASEGVLDRVQARDLLEEDGRGKPAVCVGADEGAQSVAQTRSAREDQPHAEGHGTSPQVALGWPTDPARVDAVRGAGAGLGDAACFADRAAETARGHADFVQDRYCKRGEEDCGRSGRGQPLPACSEGAGCKKRRVLVWARVDGAAREQSAGAGGTAVYNIEVEGTHSYFANGVLVHNCHRQAAESYHVLGALCSSVYYRYSFTGTHWRTGEDALAMDAISSDVIARVSVAELVPEYLATPRLWYVPFWDSPFPATSWQEAYEQGIVRSARRNELIAKFAREYARMGMPAVIVTQRRAHADELATMIKGAEVAKGGEGLLTSRTIERFRRGEFGTLVGTSVLGEGVDVPNAVVLIYAAGLGDSVTMMQTYFRPLTAAPGKASGIIVDFADNHHPTLQRQSCDRRRLGAAYLGRWLEAS